MFDSNKRKTLQENELSIITDKLVIGTCFLSDLSLYTGKMGISVFFYKCGECFNNNLYTDFAGELIDEIYEDISDDIPVNFEDGLSGIGWGIDFLFYNSFVKGNINDILMCVDEKIRCYIMTVDNISSGTLVGCLHYVISRVSHNYSYIFDNVFWDYCFMLIHRYDDEVKFNLLKMINDISQYDGTSVLKRIVANSNSNGFMVEGSSKLGLYNGCAGYILSNFIL